MPLSYQYEAYEAYVYSTRPAAACMAYTRRCSYAPMVLPPVLCCGDVCWVVLWCDGLVCYCGDMVRHCSVLCRVVVSDTRQCTHADTHPCPLVTMPLALNGTHPCTACVLQDTYPCPLVTMPLALTDTHPWTACVLQDCTRGPQSRDRAHPGPDTAAPSGRAETVLFNRD